MPLEYMHDILSLVALGIGLVAGIYLQAPIQWEHVFLIMLAGFGALVMIVWFVLSVQL
jgi:hypothetical protein|tara:strand:+ start:502 stop:675 length:174 start_codon:yes stop_codon:yes gene_type:complete